LVKSRLQGGCFPPFVLGLRFGPRRGGHGHGESENRDRSAQCD
jgi:hypothetical protein